MLVFVHCFFFLHDPATTEIYTYCPTLSLHDALPICSTGPAGSRPGPPSTERGLTVRQRSLQRPPRPDARTVRGCRHPNPRSEEHTSELPSLMRNSYAVFCLKKKKNTRHTQARSYNQN